MQQSLLSDWKKQFFYESWLNNKTARDQKEKEVKARWYKEIHKWQYDCQGGGDNLFLNLEITCKKSIPQGFNNKKQWSTMEKICWLLQPTVGRKIQRKMIFQIHNEIWWCAYNIKENVIRKMVMW